MGITAKGRIGAGEYWLNMQDLVSAAKIFIRCGRKLVNLSWLEQTIAERGKGSCVGGRVSVNLWVKADDQRARQRTILMWESIG